VALSKALSRALRHQPERYGLEVDEEGWVPVEDLLRALQGVEGREVSRDDLVDVVERSAKRRHEIREDRIRALYGHSLPARISMTPEVPPDLLFHGTSPAAAGLILERGLLPMRRQYVHLSGDRETALAVGRRKDRAPVLLVIDAGAAHRAGHRFYRGNEAVWLAESVPPRFVRAYGS
jgi:putative RNA 2'-phosphotransferase